MLGERIVHEASERFQRLLVVDQHDASRLVLMIAFRRRGYTCEGVSNVPDALAALSRLKPEVILLEWSLRDQRDVNLARRLRAGASALALSPRIVVVTHEFAPPDTADLMEIDAYLSKPVPVQLIEATLRRLEADSAAPIEETNA